MTDARASHGPGYDRSGCRYTLYRHLPMTQVVWMGQQSRKYGSGALQAPVREAAIPELCQALRATWLQMRDGTR